MRLARGAPQAPAQSPLPTGAEKVAAVDAMFDAIAPGYDVTNRVISLGLDVGWRRRTVRSLGLAPAELGPRAEAAGIAPTALRASDAVRALATQQLRGDAELKLGDHGGARPDGLERAVDDVLRGAARSVGTETAERAAARLRDQVLRPGR